MEQLFGPGFRETIRHHSGKAAVVEEDAMLTYGELDARARRIASGLASRGLKAGARVAVASDSPAIMTTVFLALQYLGAVFAPLSVRLTPEERLEAIRAADIRALVADPAYLHSESSVADLPLSLDQITTSAQGAEGDRPMRTSLADLEALGNSTHLPAPPTDDAPAVIVFSSGSDGRPKAVLWSRAGFACQFARQSRACDVTPDDVLQLAMPLYHAGGLIGVLGIGLAAGATIACHFGPFRADKVLDHVSRNGVTIVHWIPTMLRRIAMHLEQSGEEPPRLKAIHFGSMPVDDDLLQRCLRLFPHSLFQTYGSTECGFIAVLRPEDFAAGRLVTGKAIPEVRVRFIDSDGSDVAPGDVGELVVDTSTTGMIGYVGSQAMTGKVIRDGWIHSGDLARNEGDGYFSVVGRKDAMIITGGLKVYPPEVEAVLASHPGIAEAGVIGIPDPEFGRAVCAFVVAHASSLSNAELQDFCRARIASYKVPRRIISLQVLPRTATGKVAYDALRRLAGSEPVQNGESVDGKNGEVHSVTAAMPSQ